ncbi:hypothetical protein SERLA73DRAFT_126384 [Serpula lacrymans var. lacrymans S7.3]|uniref:Tc1-like transposase DDE domain-containing protein n=1 Tax=Serpula lacrymans var. lacrymans (strain S7.3) TaxID=936435 RepID=F8QCX5_SERL3|nr:hypothetical protein SERLA73DRAFT_126384 [Serpula lacrymans var. lacrymans S7.3]
MVYQLISKDLKERALWLIEHNYIPSDVCEIFNISERSLSCWEKNQAGFGSVSPPPNPLRGRPRILNSIVSHEIFDLVEKVPEMFLDEIQEWLLVAHNISISRTALYKLLKKAAAERDEDLQEEWLQDVNTHFVASQFVMVDETRKDDRTIYRHYGCAPKGRRAVLPTMNPYLQDHSIIILDNCSIHKGRHLPNYLV